MVSQNLHFFTKGPFSKKLSCGKSLATSKVVQILEKDQS